MKPRGTMIPILMSILTSAVAHSLDPDFIAPVTLEVLESLRSPTALGAQSVEVHGIDAEGRPYGEILEGVRWSDTLDMFRRGYGLYPCVEFDPATEQLPPLQYRISEGQRLIDALDALEKSSGGSVLWRLIEGRVVITGLSPSATNGRGILDHEVDLRIRADSLGSALRDLEVAFNAAFEKLPVLLGTRCGNLDAKSVAFPNASGGVLRLEGRLKFRDALLAILAATGDPRLRYTASRQTTPELPEGMLTVLVHPYPCRDAFERPEEQEAMIAEYRHRQERGGTYQAAIDARRATREAATGADIAEAGR